MYLYNLNGNKIEVFSMEPNIEKIYKFRKEKMQLIPEHERVLKAITNYRCELNRGDNGCFLKYQDINFYSNLFNRKFHNLQIYDRTESIINSQNVLLEKYYNGKLQDIKLKSIVNINKENSPIARYCKETSFLLLTELYARYSRKEKVMNNIIQLPESLYLLECMLMDLPYDEDKIEEQVKLFDISKEPIETYDWDLFKRLDEMGLTSRSTIDIVNSLNKSEKVLRYIKKGSMSSSVGGTKN